MFKIIDHNNNNFNNKITNSNKFNNSNHIKSIIKIKPKGIFSFF